MSTIKKSLTIILIGFIFFACKDNWDTDTISSNPAPNSLDGSVWVHHPDTENLSGQLPPDNFYNWFNLGHSLNNGSLFPYLQDGIKIHFTADRVLDNTNYCLLEPNHPEYSYYYDEPNIWIWFGNTNKPNANLFNPFIDKNACHITLDDYECNCTLQCYNHFRYYGRVDGDTMTLHMRTVPFTINRLVKLIRVNS